MKQKQSHEIYDQVLSHYNACHVDLDNLSDTWIHTLDQKGRTYSIDDMARMRAPGSKVTSWICDSSYLVDGSIVDVEDVVTARLLDLGESEFGCPSRNIRVNGKSYSGQFLKMVGITSHVIKLLETAGIDNPRVMEIGGGVGIIPYLLRRYYGDRLTFFSVEIPESLMIQEWYLRNTLPDVSSTYVSVPGKIEPLDGGLNFINAHVIEDQDLAFNFAINMNSMQEMSEKSAEAYIRYIEKNISEKGMFLFQNHHGHSVTSVPEPSEYEMDSNWEVESAQLTDQIGNCSESEMARFVFRRTQTKASVDARKLTLRVVWNGLLSGSLQNGNVIQDLICSPEGQSLSQRVVGLTDVLKKHQVSIGSAEVARLQDNLYFPNDSYIHNDLSDSAFSIELDGNARMMSAIKTAQFRLIGLMHGLANTSNSTVNDQVRKQVNDICADLLKVAVTPLRSEYWTAYLCSILLPLGHKADASKMLVECGAWSNQAPWLLRFAHLLANYGFTAETQELLEKVKDDPDFNSDVYLRLKHAQLTHLCGQVEDARRQLDCMIGTCAIDSVAIPVLGKTAAEINAFDVVKDVCSLLTRRSETVSYSVLLDMASTASSRLPKKDILELVQHLAKSPDLFEDSPALSAKYGALMSMIGESEIGLPLIYRSMESFRGSYFDLGWLGNILQNAGLNNLADTCFDDSTALRPENFMHHEFIGNIYLSADRVGNASRHFGGAVGLKPNLRHLRGKAAYCALSQQLRDSGVFGQAGELSMIFQRRQDFYQIGPSWK